MSGFSQFTYYLTLVDDRFREIDSIFSVSKTLKESFLSSLSGIRLELLPHTEKVKIENLTSSLKNISDRSIASVERKNSETLYALGLTLVVSVSEQILKDIFRDCFIGSFNKIDKINDKSIKLSAFKDYNFSVDQEIFAEIVLENVILSDLDSTEKINFQNIKTIEGVFSGYFGIDKFISEEDEKKLGGFFQLRHVLLHSGGIADKRFVENMRKIGETQFKIDEQVSITQKIYEDAREEFFLLFAHLITELALKDISTSEKAKSKRKRAG